MPELEELLARVKRPMASRDWFRIEMAGRSKTAEVWIYDAIGSSLFEEGTDSKAFAKKLQALDVDEIVVHLNTPGGDVFEGLAIYNSLKDHPAKITVMVDGLAASAGSFIAQAGDVVKMNRAAQMMIHDAGGLVMGNAKDMTDFAEVLDKVSDSIAGIYMSRVGGTVDEWREAMRAESWYSAAEAVEVGLADEMVQDKPAAENSWDFSVFNYAGREKAPTPILNHRPSPPPKSPEQVPEPRITPAEAARRIHAASVRSAEPKKEGAGMDPAKIREALGLKADASDDEVKTALASAGLVEQPNPEPAPEPTPEPQKNVKPELAHASSTITIDASAWQEREDRIKRLEARDAERRREERDQVLAQAVADGKFPPARKELYARLWDSDPEGTRQVIAGLARNVIPTAELGYSGDDADAIDDEFKHLFPPSLSQKGA